MTQRQAPPPWQSRSKCSADDNLKLSFFFPTHEVSPTHDTIRAYCEGCPVRLECFAHAEPFGSWGGTSEWERASWRDASKPDRCTTCSGPIDPNDIRRYSGRTIRRCRSCR